MPEFRSPADVMSAACQLQDRLGFIAESEAASTIEKALFASWGTTSESLRDMARALTDVRPVVRRTLDDEALTLLDATVSGANELAEPASRPSMWRAVLGFFKR